MIDLNSLVRDKSLKIILLIVFSLSIARSQNEPFNFEQLTIKDGLTHNSVDCILQDRHGFLWFGTPNGLNRFDGYKFEPISELTDKSDRDEIRFVHSLYEDQSGNIWIGTQKSGIFILNREKGEIQQLLHHQAFAAIAGAWITDIFQDDSSNIWIGTLDDGLLIVEPDLSDAQHLTMSNSDLISDQVMDFATDHIGNVWIATSGLGLNKYNLQTQTVSTFHTPSDLDDFGGFRKVLYFDASNNCLWIGTEGSGLYKMNTDDLEVRQYRANRDAYGLNHNLVRDVVPYSDSLLLIATDGGGLNVLNVKTDQFTQHYAKGNLPGNLNTNAILNLYIDKDKNIWLGTFNGGINVYKNAKTWFKSYSTGSGPLEFLADNSILSMLNADGGEIYFGTDGSGLAKINIQSETVSIYNAGRAGAAPLKSNIVKVLFNEQRLGILLGFFNSGLDVLDQKKRSDPDVLALQNIIPQNANVWAFEQGLNGSIWIGTLGLGLYQYDPISHESTLYSSTGDEGSLSDNHILCILRDSKARIWIGTADGGLNLFQPESKDFKIFKHVLEDTFSVSSNTIHALFEDSKGNIWIGTEGGGLNLMESVGRFKQYRKRQGLISEDIMGIVEDKFGHIWFSTHKNISRLDSREQEVTNFYFEGDQINQFNQNSILIASDGLIYFGGIKGITIVNPANVKINDIQPNVVFTGFEINNIKVFPRAVNHQVLDQFIEDTPHINVLPRDDVFSIEFSSIDFTDPHNTNYKYTMNGFDDSWTYVGSDDRKVTYTNLFPGDYEFLVQSTNSAGKWHSNTAVLKISILPSFWQTNWFKSILMLTLATLAILVARIVIVRREFLLKQRVLSAEGEVLKLNNEMLETEISNKNTRLMSTTLQMAHKNEILGKIKLQLENIPSEGTANVYPKLRTISRSINSELRNEDFWDQFNFFFNQVNTDYLKRLQSAHTNLTQNDMKLCALIKTGMSTKEIASVLNITGRGVEKSRYRLKKKLNLDSFKELNSYLTHH